MVELKTQADLKVSETSTVPVDVRVEADTATEAVEALQSAIKQIVGDDE